jgi:hypothetical protein
VPVRQASEQSALLLLLLLLFLVAASQGFPDHHVFVGLAEVGTNGSHGKGTKTVDARYMQVC